LQTELCLLSLNSRGEGAEEAGCEL